MLFRSYAPKGTAVTTPTTTTGGGTTGGGTTGGTTGGVATSGTNIDDSVHGTGGAAHGGLMAASGRYLRGDTDGMADKIPSSIDGTQPAKLSHGEFVIPADVVSHLGNGNSDAGANVLYKMMDRVRKARTGTTRQG